MNHILIPCDFSPAAEEAFKFGISIARITHSKITVLYVVEIPMLSDSPYDDRGLFESLERSAGKKFDEWSGKAGEAFPDAKLVVKEGPVATTINCYTLEHSVDAVVMGTRGATGFKEFFIGSNTEKVVRFSPVPVFAIRKAVEFSGIRNIVYPTSLELNQADFIEKLKRLQGLFKASLHLLYVNTPHCFMTDADMEEFIKFYDLSNVTFSLRNSPLEQEGILAFADEKQPDLLVMATHGRKGLAHVFSGSITEDVVNRIECPIWTYTLKKTTDTAMAKLEELVTAERSTRNFV